MRRSIGAVTAAVLTVIGLVAGLLPAFAASEGATFTGGPGTVTAEGTLYAKDSGALTLSVTAPSGTKCVEVSGAHTGKQGQATAKTSWTFSLTAGTGDGERTVTAKAFPNYNTTNGNCSGSASSTSASYTSDNTGPVVTPSLAPAPNGGGWNKSDVTVTWNTADAGAGVNRVCTGPTKNPSPCQHEVTSNTSGTLLSASAVDRLGNSGSGSVTVKLDESAPTITGSRSPAANSHGWNKTDVGVSFLCADNVDGSGIAATGGCVGNTTVSAEGSGQSVTGIAKDAADNTASATVSNINIDKTKPTLSGAATTSPGEGSDGWYAGDVAIAWSCDDPAPRAGVAASGIASGACPSNSTITSEGTGLTTSASVTDRAGNASDSASSPAVKIDRTAPTTDLSGGSAEWTNATSVTLTLSPSDAGSGVAATKYKVNGGDEQTGTSLTLTGEGIHTVRYWSVDKVGHTETARTTTVKIDRTAPGITFSLSPNSTWTNQDVAVSFNCTDAASGIRSCTPDSTVSTEGVTDVEGSVVDNAGNTNTATATVRIDKTDPTITAAADRAANGAGWYNADVVVSFSCNDNTNGSGIANGACPGTQTLGEGVNQSASAQVSDIAGNQASASATGINIDKTAPTISGSPSGTGANGWFRDDVTITWSCDDTGGSGLAGACPAPTVLGNGAAGAEVCAPETVADRAGNEKSVQVCVKIDRTAPETTASASPDATGTTWTNEDVTVTLSPGADLSGIAATYYRVGNGEAQTGTQLVLTSTGTVSYWSVDVAGNVERAGTITVNIDKAAPTGSASFNPLPNAAGWHKGDVEVSFTCDDTGGSELASCPGSYTLSSSTSANKLTVTDHAGNSADIDIDEVRIDKVEPTIDSVSVSDEAMYLTAPDSPTCTASDPGGSGVDAGGCSVAVSALGGGRYSYVASATDVAGNAASVTGRYTVNAYTFHGFRQPINDVQRFGGSTSVFKAGSTVPLKFQLSDAAEVAALTSSTKMVQARTAPAFLRPTFTAMISAAVNEAGTSATATTDGLFRWDSADQQHVYNWSTKGLAPGAYKLSVRLDDGQVQTVVVVLR